VITATQLYNHLVCPHRVSMDAHANTAERDPTNPFVELLWERGSLFETETIAKLNQPFTDLSKLSGDAKEQETRDAIARGDTLIYAGRLSSGELTGQPDLLRRDGSSADGKPLYVAIDIKSGAGEEGPDDDDEDGKPKRTYGVQLALYTDILIQLGISAGRYAYIWDVHGREVRYEFDAALGPKSPESMWGVYLRARMEVGNALKAMGSTKGASSAACKLCVWYSSCLSTLENAADLTLLPELGRVKRDALQEEFPTLQDLAGANVERYVIGKKTKFAGIGPESLRKFNARARLVTSNNPLPYLKRVVEFPLSKTEIYFDIETDPMRDICYLHGFVVREDRDNRTEKFHAFFAEDASPEAEEEAFAKAWHFIASHPAAAIYIYSKYERTIYRKLASRYPSVCNAEDVEALFSPKRTIDLYFDVVKPATEWPTRDFSVKSIAKHLGFAWRDRHPSGAASIQWYDTFIKTGEQADKQRILDYNEDDCKAMRVLRDALPGLRIAPS
jgi:predicted RecB family nuclease